MACTKLYQFLATPSISNCLIAIFQKLVEIFSPNFHTLLHSLFPLIPSLPNILHTSYFFSYFHLNVKNFVFFPLFRASRPNFRSFAKFIQSCKNLTSGVDNSIMLLAVRLPLEPQGAPTPSLKCMLMPLLSLGRAPLPRTQYTRAVAVIELFLLFLLRNCTRANKGMGDLAHPAECSSFQVNFSSQTHEAR